MADTDIVKLPPKAGAEIGQSGTLIQNGIISQEEYNRDLVGKWGIRTYDIMRRSDATVRRTLLLCKLPILASQKEIQPASDDPEDVFRANFIARELGIGAHTRKIKFHQFQREALTLFDFGHSVFEKVLGLTLYEGRSLIGLDKLSSRKQRSIYAWQMENGKPGITQMLPQGGNVSIPREKLAIFTHDLEGENWEGTSLLRSAYKDWDIKDKLIIINAIALEKMALGVPIVKPEGSITVAPGELEKVRQALRQMRANEEAYMELPQGLLVEMLDLKANQTKDVMPTVKYHDRQIVASVLAAFTEMGGESGSGSQSLSKDLSSLFMKSEEAADKILTDTIQEDIIKFLCDLNFSDNEKRGYPTIVGGNISDDDITVMAGSIKQLMEAGALSVDPLIEKHVRKVMKLPELSKELEDGYAERAEQAKAAAEAAKAGLEESAKGDPEKAKKELLAKTDKKEEKPVKASADELVESSQAFRRQINVLIAD